MDTAARKECLRYLFGKVVDPLGFKFTPDEELVDMLLEAEVKIELDSGAPYCPCQRRTKVRAEDMKIVCPCIPSTAALRCHEAVLVRALRAQGRDRPDRAAADT